jgi:uncharacterized membrane-anchored protein YjiN (DUF445 family)
LSFADFGIAGEISRGFMNGTWPLLEQAPRAGIPTVAQIDPRLAGLKRMRRLATLMLVGVGAIFVAASVGASRYRSAAPFLAYVRAFAEASVVGACADWFAVVALFRHPLGIPIPHTAIVPRNKERISETIGGFIINNFLTPSVLTARLATLDIAGWWARWLEKPGNAALVAGQVAGIAPPIAELLACPEAHEALSGAARRGLGALPAAPLVGQSLLLLVEKGFIAKSADWLLDQGERALTRHGAFIREQVSKNTSTWIPKWLDDRLADRVLASLRTGIDNMRKPEHPWRAALELRAQVFAAKLMEDPATAEEGERIKSELLDNPRIAAYLDPLWRSVEDRLQTGGSEDPLVRNGIEKALHGMARMLDNDRELAGQLNEWTRGAVARMVAPNRDAIGSFVGDVVSGWDDETLVNKIELQAGKDLQYIRINGTIVGGLVGLLIFTASRIADHFHLFGITW